MDYTVFLKKSAEKELDSLPENTHNKIVKRLFLLKENPRPKNAKKLRGREGYRIRAVIIEFYMSLMTQTEGLRFIRSLTGKMSIARCHSQHSPKAKMSALNRQ
jgi:hypothetical protein